MSAAPRLEPAPVHPHDLDTEEHVVGAILTAPERAIDAVRGIIVPADFYRATRLGTIYGLALEMRGRGEGIDGVTVADELEKRGKLEVVGGRGRIRELIALSHTIANVAYHARVIRRHANARRALEALHPVNDGLWNGGLDPAAAERAIEALRALQAGEADSTQLVDSATFVLEESVGAAAVWGRDDAILWAAGEPLLIVGPIGVGKTTLLQRLALARCGIRAADLLELPVVQDDRPILYLALDRPQQAARSLARMVGEEDHEALRERLTVWRGPLPFEPTADLERLASWVEAFGAGTVLIDSLKDLALDLEQPETGARLNRALQHVVAAGIEVAANHHMRKAQPQKRQPRTLDDVFGGWLAAGAGSVVMLDGNPGAREVTLRHLRQPAEVVGPLTVVHDHRIGRPRRGEPAERWRKPRTRRSSPRSSPSSRGIPTRRGSRSIGASGRPGSRRRTRRSTASCTRTRAFSSGRRTASETPASGPCWTTCPQAMGTGQDRSRSVKVGHLSAHLSPALL